MLRQSRLKGHAGKRMESIGDQDHKPRICIVAHFAYGAMTGGTSGHIGGVERQTTLLARWLAGRGYCVSMLTWDEGQTDVVTIDGVQVIKMCRREAGIPGLRFFHPRWTSLSSALRRTDADVYYHNCGEYVTGQVALWCRRRRRKFVYSVANDPSADPRLQRLPKVRERVLYRYGLRHADRIIVQTRRQQAMLRSGFNLDSVVIPMPCPDLDGEEYRPPLSPSSSSPRILWVGRICIEKRPDRLIELARRRPQWGIDLVGPFGEDEYSRQIRERAVAVGSLTLHGGVPRDRMSEFYKRAACLCCTSDSEGFPNTFLEAWSHGLPVVSTYDPDHLIAAHKMGGAARGVDGLVDEIDGLLSSPARWREASENARRYFVEHHSVERAMPRFEQVFVEVCSDRVAGRDLCSTASRV